MQRVRYIKKDNTWTSYKFSIDGDIKWFLIREEEGKFFVYLCSEEKEIEMIIKPSKQTAFRYVKNFLKTKGFVFDEKRNRKKG